MVTGGLEGHDPPGEVEGGGQDALGSVGAHRGAKRQRTLSLLSAIGGFRGCLGADLPSWSRAVAEEGGVWVVLLHHHHQGGLSTAGCARPVRRASRGCRKYLPAPPGRQQIPQPGSIWLRPRSPSSPEVSRAMIHPERWRVKVRTPSDRSACVVAPSGSVLDHF